MHRALFIGSAELKGEESGKTATTPVKNPDKYKEHDQSKLLKTGNFKD